MAPRYDDRTWSHLLTAATAGDLATLTELLPKGDPSTQHNRLLRAALSYEHEQCVRLLLPLSNLSDEVEYEYWITHCIEIGNLSLVKFLADQAPHTLLWGGLFLHAVREEKADIVRYIIPLAWDKIQADERYSYKALEIAALQNNAEIFNDVLGFSDPERAWSELQAQGRAAEDCPLLIEHLERVRQKQALTQAVDPVQRATSTRKI